MNLESPVATVGNQGHQRVAALMLLMTTCLLLQQESSAFSVAPFVGAKIRSSTLLYAKTSKKKTTSKSNSASSTGGFGRTTAAPASKVVDNYAVFPALEQRVEDSLIPSPPELQEVGALPGEVYDRLDKIYGFPNFNFQNVPPTNEKVSLDDLISAPAAVGSNFADLLASATGDESMPSPTKDTPKKTNAKMDAISNLPQFSEFRVLHVDPLVLAIDDFFTDDECDRYVAMSTKPPDSDDSPFETRSKTVGKDRHAKAQRTSTTWFHHYKNVPELMSKASRLLGLDGIDQWEEAQTVRYRRNEKFTWHLDALAPGAESAPSLGGQRTATLLVYLTDLSASDGGATIFRDLSESNSNGMLKVQPKKGSALLFFPAAGGIPNAPFDIRTLHCGEAVSESSLQDKWISQLWLRESTYTPSAPPGNQHDLARAAIAEYCMTLNAPTSGSENQ